MGIHQGASYPQLRVFNSPHLRPLFSRLQGCLHPAWLCDQGELSSRFYAPRNCEQQQPHSPKFLPPCAGVAYFTPRVCRAFSDGGCCPGCPLLPAALAVRRFIHFFRFVARRSFYGTRATPRGAARGSVGFVFSVLTSSTSFRCPLCFDRLTICDAKTSWPFFLTARPEIVGDGRHDEPAS
jgi:hypothetical protein